MTLQLDDVPSTGAAATPAAVSVPRVTKHLHDDRVELRVGGEPFTAYVFGDPDAPRPYFYPLLGPGGAPLTRRFPMETTETDEPTDHPHHRSLWTSHGDVNGHDNWNARPNHAVTRFRRFEEHVPDDTIIAHSDYLDADGGLLCHERLTVRVIPLSEEQRLIDWRVTLTAPKDAAVHLGDTKEAGLVAVRLAAPLQGDRGGTIENAEGARGEGECWGKPSRWCDCSGRLTPDGETIGVAILSHPDTFGHPTHWHVRAYGLFAANPFGLSSFTKGAARGDVDLAPGESISFRYAVIPHRGDATTAGIKSLWQRWSASE